MEHLIPLRHGWSLWRTVLLRSAGFPAERVTEVAHPRAAGAVDRWLDENGDPERKRAALEAFQSARLATTEALRRLAADPRFREAVTWQNRRALETGLDSFLTSSQDANNARSRSKEALLASYLQRYCLKNDTIGFFGPFGWATITPSGPPLTVRPGSELLSRRTVFFEHWAVEAIAEGLSSDPELRPFARPRRSPLVALSGDRLLQASGSAQTLPEEYAKILAACDGERSARQLAEALGPELELEEEEIFQILEELARSKVLLLGFEVPVLDLHAEETLARTLESIEEEAPRARARSVLEALIAARDQVARAAGDAQAVGHAARELEQTFERLTGQAGARRAGEIYAGRSTFYEDTVRDVECTLGPRIVEELSAPLSLLLAGARWFTWEIARRYRQVFDQVHAAASAESGPEVPLGKFLAALEPHLSVRGDRSAPIRETVAELQKRWGEILALDPDAPRCDRRSADLESKVLQAFSAPSAGWPDARYHTPDLLLAASCPEAIARGEYSIILGELHVALNTLFASATLEQHPDVETLLEAARADLGRASLATVLSRAEMTRTAMRAYPDYLDVELGSARSPLPRSRVIPLAELVVEARDGRLQLHTRDRRRVFDPIECLQQFLGEVCSRSYDLLPPLPHRPRITIDRLVIERERWQLDPAELAFAREKDAFDRFAGARRFRRERGLPQRVFVTIPEERKPFYADFESPLYVELLAKQARRASRLSITEILPDVGENWLPDGEGRRYTSELRVPAVDPLPWKPEW